MSKVLTRTGPPGDFVDIGLDKPPGRAALFRQTPRRLRPPPERSRRPVTLAPSLAHDRVSIPKWHWRWISVSPEDIPDIPSGRSRQWCSTVSESAMKLRRVGNRRAPSARQPAHPSWPGWPPRSPHVARTRLSNPRDRQEWPLPHPAATRISTPSMVKGGCETLPIHLVRVRLHR